MKNKKERAPETDAISIRSASVELEGCRILSDINWRVGRGENWFVLGANGAGKTTLMKMIMGFQWPVYGAEIRVLGMRYGECDLHELRKKISWMSPFLQNWTSGRLAAIDVVLSGLDNTVGLFRTPTAAEKSRAAKLMEKLECAEIAGHRYETLSSGEQMKALMARSMITEPELLILDEPCVHLDMKSREYFLEYLGRLLSGRHAPACSIFITHRIEEILPVFTKGMIIKNGKIFRQGERKDMLRPEPLSKGLGMELDLHRTKSGRLWPVPK